MNLECYVIYDRQRQEFYNYKSGFFGEFVDASLHGSEDEAAELIPFGEEWCVVMKVTATAQQVPH
jgi:hypothetical protein